MKKTKEKEEFFSYENFIQKSEEGRYYELKQEVKNTLKMIEYNEKIAGGSTKEKQYNILKLYEYKLNESNYDTNNSNLFLTILISYVSIGCTFIGMLISFGVESLKSNPTLAFAVIFILLIVGIIGVSFEHYNLIKIKNKHINEEKKRHSYYLFYYTEIQKNLEKDKKKEKRTK